MEKKLFYINISSGAYIWDYVICTGDAAADWNSQRIITTTKNTRGFQVCLQEKVLSKSFKNYPRGVIWKYADLSITFKRTFETQFNSFTVKVTDELRSFRER